MTERALSRRLAATSAALVLALAGVSGCDDDDQPANGTPAGSTPAGQLPASSDFAGIYLAGPVSVASAEAGRLVLVSTISCTDLRQMLGAGQWRVLDELALPDVKDAATAAGFGIATAALLARDDQLAFATFSGTDQCSAALSRITPQEITLTGPGLPGKTTGWTGATMCMSYGEKNLTVSLYFDTDAKTGGMLRVDLKPDGSGYVVRADDSSSSLATVISHHSRILNVYSQVYGAALQQQEPTGMNELTVRELSPGEHFKGTATLTANADPPAGTVTLAGLVDENTGDEATISLPFSCPATTAS